MRRFVPDVDGVGLGLRRDERGLVTVDCWPLLLVHSENA